MAMERGRERARWRTAKERKTDAYTRSREVERLLREEKRNTEYPRREEKRKRERERTIS